MPLAGPFCHECGQRRFSDHDTSIRAFAGHALHELTHFDTKIFRSLVPLVLRPGELTEEYLAGRQARYVKPLTMFILINVFFFLVGYRSGLLKWSFEAVVSGPHRAVAQRLVEAKIRASGVPAAAYEERFMEAFRHNQRSMFFVIIPLFALALRLLYAGTRRHYVEHLIYSIHFHSFLLVVMGVLIPLLALAAAGADRVLHTGVNRVVFSDTALSIEILVLVTVYSAVALRRVYRQSMPVTLVKAALCFPCEALLTFAVYKPLLFFVTYVTA